MREPKRVDTDEFLEQLSNLPKGKLDKLNQLDHEQCVDEHKEFMEYYQKNECYLCKKSFKTISKNNPCLHWLLRQCKFKSKSFNRIYREFDYHQMISYLRWVANQERFQGNINDLEEEKSNNKLFETTIKWKNIEWTLTCSLNDYSGHNSSNSIFPHYHFQMRINGQPFIKFNQHHIPFSDRDLFYLDLLQQRPDIIHHSFGTGGSGMQEAIAAITPKDIIAYSTSTDNEKDATYHMQSIITAKDKPIKGEDIQAMIEESKKMGKPIASLIDKHLGDSANVQTIISPADTIPDIAKRSGRKKKQTNISSRND